MVRVTVHAQFLNGKIIDIPKINTKCSVAELKKRIGYHCYTDRINNMKLVLAGREVKDNSATLCNYNIGDGSKVFVILHTCLGGCYSF